MNTFLTHKAITVKGAKIFPTAHDLERSQLIQLSTQLLSGSLWYVRAQEPRGDAAPRRPVAASPLAPAFSCGSLRSPKLDCKTVVFFFLKISKEISKAWCKRVLRARPACETSFFFIVIFSDLLFDCSRVLEYSKIRTVLQTSPKRRASAQATLWERE